jgi:hypothetical protein
MESIYQRRTRSRQSRPAHDSKSTWTASDDERLLTLVRALGSCQPEILVSEFPGKSIQQISERWNKVLNPELVKGSWSPEEDEAIERWVSEHGASHWSTLAATLPGRLGKQCRERWVNSLDPDIDHKAWTGVEDEILVQNHALMGNKWTRIASLLPGRTENNVKNRWNSCLKRRLERIARGENPVQKRGRKPKPLSRALPSDDDLPMPVPDNVGASEISGPPSLVLPVGLSGEKVGLSVCPMPMIVSLILPGEWAFDEDLVSRGAIQPESPSSKFEFPVNQLPVPNQIPGSTMKDTLIGK